MTRDEIKQALKQKESLILNDQERLKYSGDYANLESGITHYEVKGEGDPVVLTHGYATPYYIYDKIFDNLVKSGYKVLRYDLLGRGFSERVEEVYNAELFARQLDEISKFVFGDTPFYLVGTSMGGTITTTFYRLHPNKVKKLVLLAPAGMDTFKPPFYMKLCKIKGLGDFIFKKIAGGALLKKCASELIYSNNEVKDYYERKFAEAFKYKGFLNATLSSLRNTILKTDLSMAGYYAVEGNKLPCLCIWGTNDKTMPYYQHSRFEEVCPSAKFITYEGSGHIFLFDEGERTVQDIRDFLEE